MQQQVLFTKVVESEFILTKYRNQIELHEDFLRLTYSRGINKKKDFTEKDLNDDIREIRYEDVISYQTVEGCLGGSSITFLGQIKRIHGRKETYWDSSQFLFNNRKDYIEVMEKIKELTPMLTRKEKRDTYPPECFGTIIITLPIDFYVQVDREDVGATKNGKIVLSETYGRHWVRVGNPQADFSDSSGSNSGTMNYLKECVVELNENTPVVHLKKKGWNKLECVND